ncbi:intercellular adhesion molecule 5-like isoform X2 [Chrysemys picta bellii]
MGGVETSLTTTDRKSGPGWVAFRLVNIKEWASSPQCYFTCNGTIKLVTANISAYRAPERVVLEPLPEMELGQAYNVTCWVLNVAPVTHLTVTLRRGGETLHTETFQSHTGTGPDNITVITEITPQRRDHGQEITCHTALDLTPHGSHFENSSSAVELKVYGAAQGSFEVSVSPEAAVVEHGGSVWINCSTTCRDPGAMGGVETSLTTTDRKSGPGWVAFRLVNIKEWASSPQCYFTCNGTIKLVTANISAYRAPERVVLEPLPEMELGQAYNVTCWVLNVAPVTHLTVTLRRGGETLHTETFQSHTGTGPDNVTVITEITPQRRDHGQEITCHAALDLTPYGSHFENSSSAVELKVYGAAQGSFEVSVSPEAAVVEHGGSVWINCSTTCRDPGAMGGVETSLTTTDRKSGPGWVAFRLVNIKEWASSPQCYFTCNGTIKLVTANISAYRAPERVVLEPLPEMELGQAYNVTCWVLNVAPVTHLTVTLRRGGETLHTETFQSHTGTGPDNITVITEITPQRRDHGQEITCHTALDLTPHGSHFENSSSAVELKVYGAAQGSFEVSVSPEAAVVEHGGSVWINCSTTCRDPGAMGGVETSLTTTDRKSGPGWVAFRLVNIKEWASSPQCYFTCNGTIKLVTANISAYRAPEQVVLEPIPEMELGQAYNVTCRVLNVAPVTHLTVTLRRWGQTLHTEIFQNHTGTGPDNVTVTHEITAQRSDHGQEITCHTALDLTPHGPHFKNSSSAVELKVYDLPEEPWLQTSRYIEVGARPLARCGVAGVFPVAGEAWFTLSFGGVSLNFTVTTLDNTATAQGEVWSPSPGQHQLNCTVTVGPVSRSAGQSVLVYRLPEPVLEVNESRTLVNSSVTVTCRSPEADPPGVLLQLRDAERVLVSSPPAQPLVQLHLTAGEEDNGREFTCEATPVSGIPAMKRTSARLTVLYGPRMDDSGCPREWIWKEETEQTFSCLARGNPAPAVVCTKDGVPVSIGVQRQVRREDAGTYHCKASNAHGSASRDVTVQVEYLNILGLALGLVGAAAALTGLGVGGYMYYRSTRIRNYRLRRQQAKQAEQGKPAEQMSLNGATQNTPELEHSV